jgi:hypothetical protein
MRWITTIVVAIVLSNPARTQTHGGLEDLKAAGGGCGGGIALRCKGDIANLLWY